MNAYGSHVVHPGGSVPSEPVRRRIAAWLQANGIDPNLVPQEDPVLVLSVPEDRRGRTSDTWRIHVIVVNQYHVENGRKERNFLTGEPVTFQRTVPLQVPYDETETAK